MAGCWTSYSRPGCRIAGCAVIVASFILVPLIALILTGLFAWKDLDVSHQRVLINKKTSNPIRVHTYNNVAPLPLLAFMPLQYFQQMPSVVLRLNENSVKLFEVEAVSNYQDPESNLTILEMHLSLQHTLTLSPEIGILNDENGDTVKLWDFTEIINQANNLLDLESRKTADETHYETDEARYSRILQAEPYFPPGVGGGEGFYAVNDPGNTIPGNYPPSSLSGNYPPNTMPGNYPNSMPGNYPNSMPGNYPSNFIPGNYPSNNIPGIYPNNMQGNYPNNMHGNNPNNVPGSYPNNMQGNYPNNMQGNYPNNMQGNYPNNMQGNYPNNMQGNNPPNNVPSAKYPFGTGLLGSLMPGTTANYQSAAPGSMPTLAPGGIVPLFGGQSGGGQKLLQIEKQWLSSLYGEAGGGLFTPSATGGSPGGTGAIAEPGLPGHPFMRMFQNMDSGSGGLLPSVQPGKGSVASISAPTVVHSLPEINDRYTALSPSR